ncbi:signal peptidase II, partial [Staphylococcus aureus]
MSYGRLIGGTKMHKKYFIGTSILIAVFVVIFDQVTKY